MVLFIVLLCALLAALVVALVSGLFAGAGFILVFGDVIAFVAIIWMIVKLIKRKKKK